MAPSIRCTHPWCGSTCLRYPWLQPQPSSPWRQVVVLNKLDVSRLEHVCQHAYAVPC